MPVPSGAADPEPVTARATPWLAHVRLAAVAMAVGVALVYAAHALALILYPWDWGPDEGLAFDYARRLVHDPGSLYRRSVVPVPLVYTPFLTIVLAPVVELWRAPFAAARIVALLWTAAAAGAVRALVSTHASLPLSLAVTAAFLAPLDVTFWYMLLRVDGLMIALWLWAGVLLLPRSMSRGSDELGRGRLLAGSALLMLAVLTKPTAVFHGAPIVLAWLWVNRGVGLRLAGVLGTGGLAILFVLQLLTSGGFLWVNQLWGYHIEHAGLMGWLMATFGTMVLPVLLWALAGFGLCAWTGGQPWREPALLLVVGGLAMAPGMRKFGAWWNYLLPGLAALVVAGGRWWGAVAARCAGGRGEAGALIATAALGAMAVTRPFPVPTDEDERTANAYYGFLEARVKEARRPLLANRPDYPYFHVGQPVEIDGSHFLLHAALGLPGTELVLDRLARREYGVISEEPRLWPRGPYRTALEENYRPVGVCGLAFYYGVQEYVLRVPRDSDVAFRPPSRTRCVATAGP